MDPNACYDLLEDALRDRRWSDATEHARDLWNWLVSGGFIPQRSPVPMRGVPNVYTTPRAAGLRPLLEGINKRLA